MFQAGKKGLTVCTLRKELDVPSPINMEPRLVRYHNWSDLFRLSQLPKQVVPDGNLIAFSPHEYIGSVARVSAPREIYARGAPSQTLYARGKKEKPGGN